MTVQELSRLHRGYIDLSDRFKATWTYNQFLQGLQKVFPSLEISTETLNFQNIYAALKSVSQNLSAASTDRLKGDLERVERDLERRTGSLLEEDSKVTPSILRQFFGRVKSYDQKILVQLLRFYLMTQKDQNWAEERLDKADFLLTKLGEEEQEMRGHAIDPDPMRLHEILAGLWKILDAEVPAEATISEACREIRALSGAADEAISLDELNELHLVGKYRELKHRLAGLIFEPRVAMAVLEGNLRFRDRIEALYEQEERRIAAEYQEVFELERGAPTLDKALDADLQSFRREIEVFEKHLEHKNVRLDELTYIRRRVKDLIPRLKGSGASMTTGEQAMAVGAARAAANTPAARARAARGTPGGASGSHLSVVPSPRPSGRLQLRSQHNDLIGGALRQVLDVLEGSDWEASPKAVSSTPEARELRLQPRDVDAYRRLHDPEKCNRELEQFLLETASIRVRISSLAEEVVGLVEDGAAADPDALDLARSVTRLADQFDHRYAHFIGQALQEGRFEDARTLQYHRMRLIRDHSGLWLLAY